MNVWPILASVLPSIGVLGLFWYIMRGIIRADRREREALARLDAEEAREAEREAALRAAKGAPDAAKPAAE